MHRPPQASGQARAPVSGERRTILFLNIGHTLDHLFMLIFPAKQQPAPAAAPS